MSTNTRADLVAKIQRAASFKEQAALVAELDAYDQGIRTQAQIERELDLAGAVVQQTLVPVRTHEFHTAATDWIADFEAPQAGNYHQAAMAEAALWFGRTSAEVKADPEEFGHQAEGFMRRQASQYGEQAESVRSAGLAYLGFLYRREAASGLDQIQQTIDPNNQPKTTPLDPTTFDNFAPEVDPVNAGVVGTETSERAPLLQEIVGEGGGQGGPEKPGGHSVADDFSNGYSEVPVGAPEQMAAQGSWEGPSVAISHAMNLDQFRQREAASGLDQIQQVVDPNNQPKTTPLDTEVAFPWLLGPDAYQNGGDEEEKDVEHAASRKRANGYDHANRYDHPEYREHYQRGWDQSGRYGEPLTEDDENYDEDNPWGNTVDLNSATRGAPSPSGWRGAGDAFEDGWSDRAAGRPHGTYPQGRGRHASRVAAPRQAGLGEEGTKGSDWTRCTACGLQGSGNDMHSHPRVCEARTSSNPARIVQATRKQADQFGNSDNPHAVPQEGVANSPATTPDLGAGYEQGKADALSGDRPTFADNSPSVAPNVSQYTQGYQDGVAERQQGLQAEPIPSLPTTAKRSDRFVKAAARDNADFRKGYGFASKWKPGKPLVTLGSAEFESGIFAGLADNPTYREPWEAAHRRQARKNPAFAKRMQVHSAYIQHLAASGIDLDTMDASTSPSPTGDTPINGPGTTPPLAGGMDAAAPGGPAPYNGAEPFGTPVVPTGAQAPQTGTPTVNDIPGGPLDNPQTLAFRRNVQASLLERKKAAGACADCKDQEHGKCTGTHCTCCGED